MKKSLFFNHYSKTFENIENVINVIEEIQNVSNAYLIPLLNIKRDLIQLSNELRIELR